MNDFDFDCMQKKRLASQARHRKNGSKSKKCSLPSDRLTHRHWKERCGAVVSYNFGSPMNWEDFKQMPERIQAEYITNLQKKYFATATDLAKMFGVKPLTVARHVASKNLNVTFHRGRSMTPTQREEWSRFVQGDCQGENVDVSQATLPEDVEVDVREQETFEPETQEERSPVVFCKPQDETKPERKMDMRMISLMFSGAIDIDAIANSLRLILGNQAEGSVEIVCRLM